MTNPDLLDRPVTMLGGEPTTLGSIAAGKAALVVNVASRCGLTRSTPRSNSCTTSSPSAASP